MPWLIKSEPGREVPLAGHLFFVHVPRCGGTSLMQHFSVPQRVIEARGPLGRLAMTYFFKRYKQLEQANFPFRTPENGACALLLLLALGLAAAGRPGPEFGGVPLATWVGGVAAAFALFTTFVCTAPVIGRITPVHRWYLWFVHYPLFRLCESIDFCTGTNKHGYIMHLTAPKLLGYGYITNEEMDGMCSLAIVRNPYSRMVSIYGYNRFGAYESFPAFVRRWKRLMRPYLEDGEKEEWYTPCHLLPMFEFTHFEGKQLVQSIVKQEELKLLKTKDGAAEAIKLDSSVSDLPDLVREALLGMPHANARKTATKWYDMYDQETLDLTYEMYQKDFAVFGYPTALEPRPDLRCPARAPAQAARPGLGAFYRDSFRNPKDGSRRSQAPLFGSVRSSMRREMLGRSAAQSLTQSLGQLNRHEIFASVAGIRNVTTVREVSAIDEEDEEILEGILGSKKDD